MLAAINLMKKQSDTKSMKLDTDNTDIAPFLTNPPLVVKAVLENELRYPHGGSFF